MTPRMNHLPMSKRLLFGVGLASLIMVAPAQINRQKQSSTDSDQAAIRTAWQEYVVAWNKHDTKLLTTFLTEDVDRRTTDGRLLSGRAAALAGIERSFGINKDQILVSTHVDVRFVTQDVAILDARDELRSTSNTDPPVPTNHTSIFVRQNGKWLTTAIRDWRLTPPGAQ